MTANAGLFAEAVRLGREVIWLHTYGERFDDAAAGRPKQAPRLDKEHAPTIPVGGAVPGAPEPLPDSKDYDPAKAQSDRGQGHVDNVMPEVWAYEVSGKPVVWQWFSYRRRDRSRPIIGDRRPPTAVSARRHPGRSLAQRVHDGSDEPSACAGSPGAARAAPSCVVEANTGENRSWVLPTLGLRPTMTAIWKRAAPMTQLSMFADQVPPSATATVDLDRVRRKLAGFLAEARKAGCAGIDGNRGSPDDAVAAGGRS